MKKDIDRVFRVERERVDKDRRMEREAAELRLELDRYV
jgi:hypothetical protein